MPDFKSLRELRTDLTGLRLAAADTSLWSLGATVNEHARSAINDALRQYKFTVDAVYTSLNVSQNSWAVPRDIGRVTHLYDFASDGHRTEFQNVELIATPFTNIVRTHVTSTPSRLELHYEQRVVEVPEDVILSAPISSTALAVSCTGCVLPGVWKVPNFAELSVDSSAAREVFHYKAINNTSFTEVQRAVDGVSIPWPAGARVSAIVPLEADGVAVIQSAAQANMYRFWQSHRADYTRYTSVAGFQQMDTRDLIAFIRLQSDEADRLYKTIRKLPAPGAFQR